MIRLYPYQEKAVSHAIQMIAERQNSLIVAGTGAGKTIMLAETVKRFFHGFVSTYKKKPHILILVHRTEIHEQNHDKFQLVCHEIATSEITSARKSLHGNVHFGMVQTVIKQLDEFEKGNCFFDLIVIDELHHVKASTYEQIINWNLKGNPNAALFGVTATPNRGDGLPLLDWFDNFYQITSKFLIDGHYLVRPRFVDLSPTFEVVKGKGNKSKTEIEKGYLSKNCNFEEIKAINLLKKLCDDYLTNKEDGKSIIFAPNHQFCEMIYNYLKNHHGRKPAYLNLGIDPDTRRAELERFEKGDCEELINVDICTEGYDFPALRNVVDFDTNGTHGQFVQKCGRVLRTAPGKTTCTVIDFGGNVELYPQGVEIDVNLEGAYKAPTGEKLTQNSFYKEQEEKTTAAYQLAEKAVEYSPYHPPYGFETVNDKDCGIVFVACNKDKDCIVMGSGDRYTLFCGDKKSIKKSGAGNFEHCAEMAVAYMGEIDVKEKPISNIQIQMLAPEYPTTALTWHGANCTICWKLWKKEILT